MADFFFNYYLMPFHLSVVALILLSVVETIGMYVGLRPSQLLKKLRQFGLLIPLCSMLNFLKL